MRDVQRARLFSAQLVRICGLGVHSPFLLSVCGEVTGWDWVVVRFYVYVGRANLSPSVIRFEDTARRGV